MLHEKGPEKSRIRLATSPTGLYLITLLDVCPSEGTAFFQSDVTDVKAEVKGRRPNGNKFQPAKAKRA